MLIRWTFLNNSLLWWLSPYWNISEEVYRLSPQSIPLKQAQLVQVNLCKALQRYILWYVYHQDRKNQNLWSDKWKHASTVLQLEPYASLLSTRIIRPAKTYWCSFHLFASSFYYLMNSIKILMESLSFRIHSNKIRLFLRRHHTVALLPCRLLSELIITEMLFEECGICWYFLYVNYWGCRTLQV